MGGLRRRRVLVGLVGTAGIGGCLGGARSGPQVTGTPTTTLKPLEQTNDPWPQPGSDPGHTGVTGLNGVPDTAEAIRLIEETSLLPPIVSDGALFQIHPVPDTESIADLVARDLPEGATRWSKRFADLYGDPVASSGVITVAGAGHITALHTNSGSVRWQVDVGNRTASVGATINDVMLVSTEIAREAQRQPDVRAYRLSDGKLLWQRSEPLWRPQVAAIGDTVYSLSPKFKHGSVLTARSLSDGSELWMDEIDENGIPRGPYAAGKRVYVAPDNGGVIAYDRATGERMWRYPATTINVVDVAVSDALAYLMDKNRLTVRDAGDGSEQWSVTTGAGRIPAIDETTIYHGGGEHSGKILARSRTNGRVRWEHTFPEVTVHDLVVSGVVGQPVVVNGAVYATAADGLYRFSAGG